MEEGRRKKWEGRGKKDGLFDLLPPFAFLAFFCG